MFGCIKATGAAVTWIGLPQVWCEQVSERHIAPGASAGVTMVRGDPIIGLPWTLPRNKTTHPIELSKAPPGTLAHGD